MALQQLLAQEPPDDGGTVAFNRLAYQVNWALCLLMDLHADGADYALVLDYHDDVVAFDSATAPTVAAFYQVKTKKVGSWSISDLLRRSNSGGGKQHSKLGKLFMHVMTFGRGAIELVFVSNAALSAQSVNGTKLDGDDSILYADLALTERRRLTASLMLEHPTLCPDDCRRFRYEKTPLSTSDHPTYTLGAVAKFLSSQPEYSMIPAAPFFNALRGELDRRQGREEKARSFTELCALKSIRREDFMAMLADACAAPRSQDAPQHVFQRLTAEGVGYGVTVKVHTAARRVSIGLADPQSKMVHADYGLIQGIVASAPPIDRLFETVEALRTSDACKSTGIEQLRGTPYVQALLALSIHEREALSSADPSAEDPRP